MQTKEVLKNILNETEVEVILYDVIAEESRTVLLDELLSLVLKDYREHILRIDEVRLKFKDRSRLFYRDGKLMKSRNRTRRVIGGSKKTMHDMSLAAKEAMILGNVSLRFSVNNLGTTESWNMVRFIKTFNNDEVDVICGASIRYRLDILTKVGRFASTREVFK